MWLPVVKNWAQIIGRTLRIVNIRTSIGVKNGACGLWQGPPVTGVEVVSDIFDIYR